MLSQSKALEHKPILDLKENLPVNHQEANKNQGLVQFESEILDQVKKNYPDYYDPDILHYKSQKLPEIASMFDTLLNIYNEREKHELHWAFKTAQNSFIFKENKKKIPSEQDPQLLVYDEVITGIKSQFARKSRLFSRLLSSLSLFVSFLDIFISVILILVVTMVSHIGESLLHSFFLSILFIGSVALVKVSLDRFAIIPMIDNWGWSWYQKAINYAKREVVKAISIYLVLAESINRNESIKQRRRLIKQNPFPQTRRIRWTLWRSTKAPTAN